MAYCKYTGDTDRRAFFYYNLRLIEQMPVSEAQALGHGTTTGVMSWAQTSASRISEKYLRNPQSRGFSGFPKEILKILKWV